MGKTTIDHEFLIKTILDNGGEIVGGYVRAWKAAGHPTDYGWKDIDCVFEEDRKFWETVKIINKKFGPNAPVLDFKAQFFKKLFGIQSPVDHLGIKLSFNDFYCNCWKFNGKFELLEPAKSKVSIEEMEEFMKNKIAKCIRHFSSLSYSAHKVFKMKEYGWKLINIDNNELPESEVLILKKRFDAQKKRALTVS